MRDHENQTVMQETCFSSLALERRVPPDHLLRSIDQFVDLSVAASTCGSNTAMRSAANSAAEQASVCHPFSAHFIGRAAQ